MTELCQGPGGEEQDRAVRHEAPASAEGRRGRRPGLRRSPRDRPSRRAGRGHRRRARHSQPQPRLGG